MYTIDTIPFFNYGLFLSEYDGNANLAEVKSQYFTEYGKEGYQITKRNGNILELNGFIIGSSLADFQSKLTVLYDLFKASGTRIIVLDNEPMECFCVDGFEIYNAHLIGQFFGRIKTKLIIV